MCGEKKKWESGKYLIYSLVIFFFFGGAPSSALSDSTETSLESVTVDIYI